MRAAALSALVVVAMGPTAARGPMVAAVPRPSGSPGAGKGPAPSFQMPAPQRTVLKNGLTVLILERRAVPLVQMQLLVRSGSVSDPAGREGTAAILARLLKRGTPGRTAAEFAEAVEFLGGTLSAEAGRERIRLAGEFGSRDFEAGLALLAGMALSPSLSDAEFEKERALLLAEHESSLDDPAWIAARAFDAWLFGDHPYGRPPEGTKRSVAGLKRSDVAAFHQAHFSPANAVLAIVGDVEAREARGAVERLFGSWRGRSAGAAVVATPAPAKGRRVLLVDKPDATQSQIRFGFLGPGRSDPDLVPLTVVNAVLGNGFTSWLVDEIRVKRGLTYSIRSSIQPGRRSGSYVVSTFSKNATVAETVRRSIDLMSRMRADGPGEADLDKGRNYVAGLYPLRIESPDALAAEILDVEFYGLGPDYINGYQGRIRGVGIEAARAAATRHVPVDDLAIVVVGPARELRGPLEEIGPVTVRPAASIVSGEP
jgi:zinc protease